MKALIKLLTKKSKTIDVAAQAVSNPTMCPYHDGLLTGGGQMLSGK